MPAEAAACSHRQPLKKDQRACSGCLRLPIPSPSVNDGQFFAKGCSKNFFHTKKSLFIAKAT
jgi:hypothetical protein